MRVRDAFGDDFNAGACRDLVLEADAVADRAADLFAQLPCHEQRGAACGDPARLQQDDFPALQPWRFEQGQWYLGGLAGAGRGFQHQPWLHGQVLLDLRQQRGNREERGIHGQRIRGHGGRRYNARALFPAMTMHLIDIGANLTHDSFDRDRDAVLDRARQAGVVQMVITGASREHSPLAVQLAQQHPGFLYATAGVHPHHAVEYTEECDAEMRALHDHPEVVAVGECGLDYFRDFSPRPAQHRAFERQLQLAADNGKPLFLHQRDAHADFMAQMKNFEGRIGPAVVHCFTGERDELFDYLDQDWYIGITGWLCDERRGAHLRELVKNIPANRLMIETDAPYLLPRTLKPMPKDRRNEPMFLSHIVEELARDRGEDVAVTAANATAATRAFFRLPDAG